jgi:hypothetical protein
LRSTRLFAKLPAAFVLSAIVACFLAPLSLSAATDCVNSLDYFIGGDKLNWKGSNGTHKLSQNFSSNLTNGWMYYIKFGDPYSYEHYTWDSSYIYLRQDGWPTPYTFSQAEWLKNGTICKGDLLNSPTNQITTYNSSCSVTQAAHSFPITVQYVDHWPIYPLGGTRGNVDVILVDYHYGGNFFERFFYSRQYGWVRWELWNSVTQQLAQVSTFDSDDVVNLAITSKPPKCDNY